MRVLVTGRAGQLVRSLVERAKDHPDIELLPVGRPELDLADPESIARAIGDAAPDAIINAAAYTAVDDAEDHPELAQRINGDAAGEIAAAARRSGARLIQISTDYVFDGCSPRPHDESAPTNPQSAYGRSKLAGEVAVRQATADHMIVRTAWVYSPFGSNFLRTMMQLAMTRERLSVVGDQRGNPSSALDLADGLLEVLGRWRRDQRTGLGETYHLAGKGAASWCEFAAEIMKHCRAAGLPAAEITPIASADWPARAPRPMNSTLDCAKFAGDFGFVMPRWQESAGGVVRRIVDADVRAG